MTESSYRQICEVPITLRSPPASSGPKQEVQKAADDQSFQEPMRESQAGSLAAMCLSRWFERASLKNIQANLRQFLCKSLEAIILYMSRADVLVFLLQVEVSMQSLPNGLTITDIDRSRHIDSASFRHFKKLQRETRVLDAYRSDFDLPVHQAAVHFESF